MSPSFRPLQLGNGTTERCPTATVLTKPARGTKPRALALGERGKSEHILIGVFRPQSRLASATSLEANIGFKMLKDRHLRLGR
jgi:hypothetical protein